MSIFRALLGFEIISLLVLVLTPSAHPSVGAMLFVASRWALYFVARKKLSLSPRISLFLASVPWLGLAWWESSRRVRGEQTGPVDGAVSPGTAADHGAPDWLDAPSELLQLNVQLMSAAIAASERRQSPAAAPLVDVATGADYRTKQQAVASLKEFRSLEGIRALKVLRAQPDADLQYLAATALASIEQSENALVQSGEREILESPSDVEVRLRVARSLIFLCRAKLLASSMTRAFLARAERHLRHAREKDAARPELLEMLAEVLALQGKDDDAVAFLAPLRKPTLAALETLATLRLRRGELAELADVCAQIRRRGDTRGKLQEAAASFLENRSGSAS